MPERADGLRQSIFEHAGRSEYIYVDECIVKRYHTTTDNLELIDELASRIADAKEFICLLAGSSHGSPISINSANTAVSYFEIEIFLAALSNKPVHLLVHDSFFPEPSLESLLHALSFAFPSWRNAQRLSTTQVIRSASNIVARMRSSDRIWPLIAIGSKVKQLTQILYASRGRHGKTLEFLGGNKIDIWRTPDLNIAMTALTTVEAQTNHREKLSCLWIALRELNTSAVTLGNDVEAILLLERALDLWSGAGAWYGLNADLHLGCLAALNTVHKLRVRLRELGHLSNRSLEYPAGALASAKYNVAKHLIRPADRRERLLDAMRDANTAIEIESDDLTGLLAVRGAISRRLGNRAEAIMDLERSLSIHKVRRASSIVLAGTLSELGFCNLVGFNLRLGLKQCDEAVFRLREVGAEPTELARALRKLGVALAANGRLIRSKQAFAESRSLALSVGAMDQAR